MIPCSWKENFGVECPTCGAQRSFLELITGDFLQSIALFPALIPLLFLVVFVPLHFYFKYKNGAKIILTIFIFSVLLILINFVVKVSNGEAFIA